MLKREGLIVLRRADVTRLVDFPKPLRDQLILELARTMGLRSGEICSLRWENIDLDESMVFVLDSKKKQLFPVPLAWQVERLIHAIKKGPPKWNPTDGYVVRPFPSKGVKFSAIGQPFTTDAVCDVVKRYAQLSGIRDWQRYTPRLLRCFFAAEWHRQKRDMKVLQIIMRHKTIATTFHYVDRIVFLEDVLKEYAKLQEAAVFYRKSF